jgi:hydroxyquinol 1,2-dioxygenase
MRDVNEKTLTAAVLDTIAGADDPRDREVLTSMVKHLHAFVRDVNLTSDEWRRAMELLLSAATISDDERNEFIMFSDTLGVSSLVDLVGSDGSGPTEASLLGPFYVEGAPELGFGPDMIKDNAGTRVIVQGKVLDADGAPIPGAVLDIWQNADNGLYQVQDPTQSHDNLRCRTVSNEQGEYLFATIKPVPYPVPDDGPVGDMLRATNRHPWRAGHVHFKITADGYQPLVTELFPDDDPYLDEDAVFGVRESLIVNLVEADANAAPAITGVKAPYSNAHFNFKLSKDS